jgi:hypothetical protein
VIELCGRCGHLNDHRDKPCQHLVAVVVKSDDDTERPEMRRCACDSGVRSDVLLCQLLAINVDETRALSRKVRDLILITLKANGMSVAEDGSLQADRAGGLILPSN